LEVERHAADTFSPTHPSDQFVTRRFHFRGALMETSTHPTAPTSTVKSLTGRRDAVQSTKAAATQLPHVDTPSPRVEMSSDVPRITRIAKRAHDLYEARGGNAGRDLDDWLQAEREIDAESDNRPR